MNDDIVYNCFPLGDRISARISRLLHCDQPRMTLVDKLNKMELE
jgi:jouberin